MVINGLIFGLISTLHCAGMCGPLAMYIPSRVQSNKFVFATLYQLGRISVYISIGLLVFSVGISFSAFKMQQLFSLILGIVMVLFVLWSFLKLPVPNSIGVPYKKLLAFVSSKIAGGKTHSAFLLGVLNGLLPCGAIYIAALYCVSFSEWQDTLFYMALFGLGTMPVFIAAWFFISKKFTFQIRNFRYIYKFLPLLIGVLMILRGANLGIPYLSPKLSFEANKTEIKDCCKHKN